MLSKEELLMPRYKVIADYPELPNETMFRTKSRLSEDRFNALFNYCKGDWSTERLGEVEHEGLREDGTPKNPIVLSIKEF